MKDHCKVYNTSSVGGRREGGLRRRVEREGMERKGWNRVETEVGECHQLIGSISWSRVQYLLRSEERNHQQQQSWKGRRSDIVGDTGGGAAVGV